MTCQAPAKHDQAGRTGHVWARLCAAHHKELDEAIASLNAKSVVRAWARAGHKMRRL